MAVIKNVWLMWVGCNSYPTIEDYIKEAFELGVSKKVTNMGMAESLTGDDNIIYLAHDEGEHDDCPDCVGIADCPTCRVRKEHIVKASKDIHMYSEKKEKEGANGNTKGEKRCEHAIKARKQKIRYLKDEIVSCELCNSDNHAEISTGGYVKFEDEFEMDRISFQYWSRKPDSWKKIVEKHGEVDFGETCATCGGIGWMPRAKVFGFFIPSEIECILKKEDNETVKKRMKSKGFKTVESSEVKMEIKRGCGYRKEGAFYLVTTTEKEKEEEVKSVIKDLINKEVISPEGIEVNGDFCNFVEPVEIEGMKRFRGMKRWNIWPDVEEETEMALDALEE